MVDVKHKRCDFLGCDARPTFNFTGKTKGKFCVAHKLNDMVDVLNKKCDFLGCDARPTFNFTGKTKGKFCVAHKLHNMINVTEKKCEFEGCNVIPTFNFIGQPRGKFCFAHKLHNMINVTEKKCEFTGCKTHATYGKPGIKPTHCAKHKITGMIFKPTTRCKDCKELAIYGIKQKLIHCEAHKQPNEINLSERECVSCHLMYILDADNKCENCNPVSFAKAVLAKQTALMAYLDAHGHQGTTVDDSMIDSGVCGKERPDRIIDLHDKIIVIECDENQHKDRQCLCEQTRMVNIGQSFGGVPVYFIRWNPDTFKTHKHRSEGLNKRYDILSDFLNSIKDGRHQLPKNGLVSVIYMFYDGWSGVENLAPENWTVIGDIFSVTIA